MTEITSHARVFDAYNKHWSGKPDDDRLFLQCQQNYLNDRLAVIGHVFLNEVYDLLGFQRSSIGQLVGWLRNNGPIDFQIVQLGEDPLNDYGFNLDFNVNDGVIYDKI